MSDSWPKFFVELHQAGHESRVWRDGVEITKQLRGLTITTSVDDVTRITLDYAVVTVTGEIEGEAGEEEE